jgi:hypothetical protein
MIRSIAAFLLIFTLFLSDLTRFVIYAGFELNQEYIAAVLCENLDKPELKCEGKCFLAKKIQQAEENEKSRDHEIQKNRFQEAFIVQKADLDFPILLITTISSETVEEPCSQFTPAIFHPPLA